MIKGYATAMMTLVLEECKRSGCIASTLYSDIGPDFYSRLGWKTHPSISAILSLNNWKELVPAKSVSRLSLDCIPDLNPTRSATGFSIPVTREAVEWLFTRTTHYAGVYGITPVPDTVGFLQGNDFVLFVLDFQKRKVNVLSVRFGKECSEILNLVCQETNRWPGSFDMIEVWDAPESVWSLESIEKIERKESLSSLAIFSREDVVWNSNEYIHWVYSKHLEKMQSGIKQKALYGRKRRLKTSGASTDLLTFQPLQKRQASKTFSPTLL